MGFVPSVPVAFILLIITMIGWGSWTNTHKKCGNWRFEAFYWDYIFSVIISYFILCFILGGFNQTGWSPTQFFSNLAATPVQAMPSALFSGFVWGFGNLLLVVAIELAGLSVAFPVGIGLALVMGTLLAYITNPAATKHPEFLFFGLFIVILAILSNSLAYRAKEKAGSHSKNLKRGIIISLLCGVLIGLSPFPFNYAFGLGMTGYTGAIFFGIGGLVSTLILLPIMMRKPLVPGEKAISVAEYKRGKPAWHLWAIFGGFVWAVASLFNLIVGSMPDFSVAIAFTLGNCAPMIAAMWGIFVWKEFKGAPRESYLYLVLMFGLFLAGIIALANAAG